jgi:hypothetical protein
LLPGTSYRATFAASLAGRITSSAPYPALRTGLLSSVPCGTNHLFNALPGTSYRATIKRPCGTSHLFNALPGTLYRATFAASLAGRRGFFPLPGTSYRATFALSLRDDFPATFIAFLSPSSSLRDYGGQAATHCSTLWRQLCCWSGPLC